MAAFTGAYRDRAARHGKQNRNRKRNRQRTRAIAIVLALLALGFLAVDARTGHLPPEAQRHAHRLFSALGVPAPRTGPPSLIVQLSWCTDWDRPGAPQENRKHLIVEAGSEADVPSYCDRLRRSATPSPAASPAPT